MAKNTTIEPRTCYEEAMRYIDVAKGLLEKAEYDNQKGKYKDVVLTKAAAGIAYAGVEKAAKWLIKIRLKQEAKNADMIDNLLAKIDKKASKNFIECEQILHKNIYYNDDCVIAHMKDGLSNAKELIELLEPYKDLAKYSEGGLVGYEYHIPIVRLDAKYAPKNSPLVHDAYAVCSACSELFTYDTKRDENVLWVCPKCKISKKMRPED